jgi:UDP-2,3-diacylglucosamine pyrophosphatase LpxH
MTQYKTVFISDIHLGSIACKYDELLSFLKTLENNPPESIYLVGDIIDLWKLSKGFNWRPEHNVILQKLLRLSRKGVQIRYVVGNHDEYFRSLPDGFHFGGIEVADHFDFISVTGDRYLVIHGDQYDTFLIQNDLIARLGSFAYDLLVVANSVLSFVRRKLHMPYWSMSHYLKIKAKAATRIVDTFETTMCEAIRLRGYDGVICGHIHLAKAMTTPSGFKYFNCGDWTESCTAIIETHDGRIEILYHKTSKDNA